MTIAKNLIIDFESSWEVLHVINIFALHIFDNETTAIINLFEICTEMHFVSLFFLKEWNFTTSFLMIHSKCGVVHYANLNSSPRNKSFWNYGPLNMLFRFFWFLIYVYFNEAFVKKIIFIKICKIYIYNYHFLIQISKIHFKM